MSNVVLPSLAFAAIATLSWAVPPALSNTLAVSSKADGATLTEPLSAAKQFLPPTSSSLIAQTYYPPISLDQQAIMVIGQGLASAPADTAELQFFFINYDPYAYDPYAYDPYADPYAEPEAMTEEVEETDPSLTPPLPDSGYEELPAITEETLQPVIAALVAAGIPEDEIEINLDAASSSNYYFSEGTVEVSFSLDDPEKEQIETLVTAVEEATTPVENLYQQDVYVDYRINNCDALTRDVYTAAIADARTRATAIAAAMGATITETASVAEAPFGSATYSYTPSACDPASTTDYYSMPYYDPYRPAEVELRRDLFVTFPIQPD